MNANVYAQCKEDIRRDEGLRLFPYKDSLGKLTIGYGRCIETRGITRLEAEDMLEHDVASVIGALTFKLPWFGSLDPVRQRVLVNMGVQLGIGGVLNFRRMLEAIRKSDYELAADEMLDSPWAREQTPQRAKRLAAMMRSGEVPA